VPHDAGGGPRARRELAATGDVPSAARVRVSSSRPGGDVPCLRAGTLRGTRAPRRRRALPSRRRPRSGTTPLASGAAHSWRGRPNTPAPTERADKINEREAGKVRAAEAQRACAVHAPVAQHTIIACKDFLARDRHPTSYSFLVRDSQDSTLKQKVKLNYPSSLAFYYYND
jgi:hypothetical protein